MWEQGSIGRVPSAASYYDGITDNGQDAARRMWHLITYDSAPVIEASAADRRSVAAFRAKNAAAAKTIAAYLDQYLVSLAALEDDARALERRSIVERGRGPFAGYYGSAKSHPPNWNVGHGIT